MASGIGCSRFLGLGHFFILTDHMNSSPAERSHKGSLHTGTSIEQPGAILPTAPHPTRNELPASSLHVDAHTPHAPINSEAIRTVVSECHHTRTAAPLNTAANNTQTTGDEGRETQGRLSVQSAQTTRSDQISHSAA